VSSVGGNGGRADLPAPVRAAGGAVWRPTADEGLEVLLVHRPKYGDWSLPKGKADPGEEDSATALREVEEETGLICELGSELVRTRYVDSRGRAKEVRYWAMRVTGPAPVPFRPNREVDELVWLPLAEAAVWLSYGRDRAVLEALVSVLEGS